MNRGNGEKVLTSERGMALVLTLMVLVLITALVTEFSYGVFTSTSALNNWKDSQRLSFVAKSGVTLAVKTLFELPLDERNRYGGRLVLPVENVLEGFNGTVVITAEDENAKFNLNSVNTDDGFAFFENLLDNLGLDKRIAQRVRDWIDTDSIPRLPDSEENAKGGFLDSVDELLLIKGIGPEAYEKLLPYVTVCGYDGTNDARVNINTAAVPVIMSLAGISREAAEDKIRGRPFSQNHGFPQVRVTLKSNCYRITSSAEENGIKRVIESVVKGQTIQYWKEL